MTFCDASKSRDAGLPSRYSNFTQSLLLPQRIDTVGMSGDTLSCAVGDTTQPSSKPPPTNEPPHLENAPGETPNSISADDDLFFDIPQEEKKDSELDKARSTSSSAPLFLPSSSEATTKPPYRDSQSADIDWAPSEDERSLPPTRPLSSMHTRSAPSSVITISDSEDENTTVPPPAKKRKHASPGLGSQSNLTGALKKLPLSDFEEKHDTEPVDSDALFVGTVVVDAWSTVKGKGHLQKGEILRLERDASATGLPGKTTAKSSSKSVAALTAAAKKKVKEDAIVRVVNSRGSGVYSTLPSLCYVSHNLAWLACRGWNYPDRPRSLDCQTSR